MAGDDPPSPREDRERLEGELLDRLRAAESLYRVSAAEYVQLREKYADMLNNPDGASALHQAAKRERVALEKYSRALRVFTDLVVGGRLPGTSNE
jgi:hypothetical protein